MLRNLLKRCDVKICIVAGAMALCGVVMVQAELPFCSGLDVVLSECDDAVNACKVEHGCGSIVDSVREVNICWAPDPPCLSCNCVQTEDREMCATVTSCRYAEPHRLTCIKGSSYNSYHIVVTHGGDCVVKDGDGS